MQPNDPTNVQGGGQGRGVVLFGPPAAGKDTVTAALTAHDPRYVHFHPLKAGAGRTDGYRITSARELDRLRARGEIVWTTHRYGAQYAIDLPALRALLDAGRVPVVHLAEPAALAALAARLTGVDWQVIALRCERAVAEQRIRDRHTGDTTARLAAYDAYREPEHVDRWIDTAATSPADAAAAIASTTPAAPVERR